MDLYLGIICIFVLLSICSFKGVKNERVLLVVVLFLYFLVSFRSLTIGNDTLEYSIIFENMSSINGFQLYQGRFEFGYLLFNYLIRKVTSSFTVFLLIQNAFVYYAYYVFIKRYSTNYCMSMLLFFCFGYWGRTASAIRLEMAIACLLLAYCLYDSRKKWLGFISGFIGLLFQRTSLSYWGIYIVPRKINKKFFVFSLLITIGLYLSLERIINVVVSIFPYYSVYLNGTVYIMNRLSVAIVLKCIISFGTWLVAIIVYQKKKRDLDSEIKKNIESQINMTYVSFLILFLSTKFNIIDRCEVLYGTFELLLIPNIIAMLKKKSNVIILYCLFAGVAVAYFVMVNLLRPEWNMIYPYHTFIYDK